MFFYTIAASLFLTVKAVERVDPGFVYNGSGYIFEFESTSSGWNATGKVDDHCLGTGQDLKSKRTDQDFLNSLYKLTLNNLQDSELEELAGLLEQLPMPNLAYVDLSHAKGVDILCQGLSKNTNLRNIRSINADKSDISMEGLKAILNMRLLDESGVEPRFLIRDMKTTSSRYGVSVAQLQISVKGIEKKDLQQKFEALDGTVSQKEWNIAYICDEAPPGKAHLFFQIIT